MSLARLIFWSTESIPAKVMAISALLNPKMEKPKADTNASNISFNIVNFLCLMKCWMHLRAYKIYKKKTKKKRKKKKEDKNCV